MHQLRYRNGFQITACHTMCDIMQEEGGCITALYLACLNGHKNAVQLLIQKGANINYQNKVR